MPEISVLIPNYNHAAYLRERIDSVLNQTFQDFEVIILDDCSPDDSREVIETYRNHPKVSQIVINENNSGSTFKQWDRGINLAQGTYIWIAESDDWCEPNFLQTLYDGITSTPNGVLAYAQSYYVNNKQEIIKVTKSKKLFEVLDGKPFVENYMTNLNSVVNASMAIFKKSCYYNLSKDFTTYKYTGDWLFWIEIAKQGKVFISGKYLNFFRKHDKDVTGKAFISGVNFTEAIKILNILKKDSIITEGQYQSSLLHRYKAFQNTKETITPELRKGVEDSFYGDGNRSYERFLKKQFVKIRMKRFSKKLLSKVVSPFTGR